MNINDFEFTFNSYGHYLVTYTSPKTFKKWCKIIRNMELIDKTKNSDSPKIKDLKQLKKTIKN